MGGLSTASHIFLFSHSLKHKRMKLMPSPVFCHAIYIHIFLVPHIFSFMIEPWVYILNFFLLYSAVKTLISPVYFEHRWALMFSHVPRLELTLL